MAKRRKFKAILADLKNNILPRSKDEVKKRDMLGTPIAFYMIDLGIYVFLLNDDDILKLRNNAGVTTAHKLAYKGFIFNEDKTDILKLKDNYDVAVAHIMADNGHKFSEHLLDIYSMEEGWSGDTVAHITIRNNHTIENPAILAIKNSDGESVSELIKNKEEEYV